MRRQCISAAERWLSRNTALPTPHRQAMARLAPLLIQDLPARRPAVIGLAGLPGTGKSTLAGMLTAVLQSRGAVCLTLSLDDYYLTRKERRALSARLHPVFSGRGLPGTHALDLLARDLDLLGRSLADGLVLPRFDKATDERSACSRALTGPAPSIVLLEGWCVGAPPLEHAPVGVSTGDVSWLHHLMSFTRDYDRVLNARLHRRWFLHAPDWATVVRWRWQQEQALGERRHLADTRAVEDFLRPYKPLGQHLQATCHDWANRVVKMDSEHLPIA